jgi:hypothetical protein
VLKTTGLIVAKEYVPEIFQNIINEIFRFLKIIREI